MDKSSKKEKSVEEAKAQLRLAAARIDPFSSVKQTPLTAVSLAFLAGVMFHKNKFKVGLPPSLFSIASQVLKRI